jgi:hypothetical protein
MSQAGLINLQGGGGGGIVNSVTGANGVTASPTTGNVVVSGVNATTSSVGVASFNPAQFTVTTGAVSLLGGTGPAVMSLSDDVNTLSFPNSSGNIQLIGHVNDQLGGKFSTVVAGTNSLNINPMTTARWIVDPLGFNGTHTTLPAAIASATAGDTIFLMDGTYVVGSIALKAGVDIVAWACDSFEPNVTIEGQLTYNQAGTVSISGIQLQTSGTFALSVSGSSASLINLFGCNINCTNNTGISYSSSSAASGINLYSCTGNLATTGIAYHSHSGAGSIVYQNCMLMNTGNSTTASTCSSSGSIQLTSSEIYATFSTASTGFITSFETEILCASINTTCITTAGTGISSLINTYLSSGTASAVSAGTGTTVTMALCGVNSSNTNALTGSGTINSFNVTYIGTSHLSNVTTQTGGAASGLTQGTAPSAGFIGEQIRSAVQSVSITTTGVAQNLTSISLTAGIWDISALADCTSSSISALKIGISTNTASFTGTVGGDSNCNVSFGSAGTEISVSIPSFRVTISSSTTYYLVVQSTFGAATTGFGRISGTRVG